MLGLSLALLAALEALPFREAAMRAQGPSRLGWDASLHALAGLDLFDDLRSLRPLAALGDVFGSHWWGPFWALGSLPAHALFGRSLESASLPSLAAFLLVPPAALLVLRSLDRSPSAAALGAALVGLFALRSPMLLEVSAWPMLEALGGALTVLAWGLFLSGRLRAASLVAAALFLTKYHYGSFLLVSFVAVGLARRETREEAWAALRDVLAPKVVRGALLVVGAGGGACLLSRPAFPRLPSPSNVFWGFLVAVVCVLVVRRGVVRLPAALRPVLLFGVAPCVLWLLDPANVRGYYRQTFVSGSSAAGEMASAFEALRADWFLTWTALVLVVVGLVLLAAVPGVRRAERVALAVFPLWPAALMLASPYPFESRFFACLVPTAFAAGAAGLVLALQGPRGRPILAALVAGLAADRWLAEGAFQSERALRVAFRYGWDAAETACVESALSRPMALPAGCQAGPSIRLAWRLARKDVPPREIVLRP
ncbi:MAG: hypothetical protein JNK60_01315 [Acidobacteria bacterium]|nr:hypothetical protein [Acidobacteriota bacterium]